MTICSTVLPSFIYKERFQRTLKNNNKESAYESSSCYPFPVLCRVGGLGGQPEQHAAGGRASENRFSGQASGRTLVPDRMGFCRKSRERERLHPDQDRRAGW